MANCRQPIRTYERKTKRKPLTSISLASPVVSTKKHRVQNDYFNNENYNDSITHNPFETTFDRIAKGAVVPPLPSDISQNDSWSSTSDSDNNVTNFVKSQDIFSRSYNSPIYNDICNLIHENTKHTHKCKKPQKYMTEVISEPVNKKAKTILKKKDKIQSRVKIKVQKVQTNNIQKQKVIQQKRSSRKCNEHIYHSDAASDLKDVHKDISCDYDNKHLPQKVLRIDKDITTVSQTTSNYANDSIATSEHTLNYYQHIKPCFVKLDAYTVQNWYMLNREKIMGNEQNIKRSCINTLQTSVDTFKIQNILSQSLINVSTHEVNETNTSYLASGHNLSKTTHCNIDNVILGAERSTAYLIKDSFIKLERLNTEKFPEKKVTPLNEREKYVVSSTPIGKHMRSVHPVFLSPIENIRDTLNSRYKNSAIIAKENSSTHTSSERKDSVRSLKESTIASECYKIDITNMQEQQTQILLPSQKLSMATDPVVKVEAVSSSENIRPAFMQEYNAQSDTRTELPHSLNISADTDRSQSLFGDTIYIYDHSTGDIVRHNTRRKCAADTPENKFVKISNMAASLHLFTDLNLKQKKELLIDNTYIDTSSGYATSPKIPMKMEISEDSNNTECTRQEYKSQEKRNIEINSMEIVCKNSKNETVNDSKYGSSNNSQDELSINAIDGHVLLTKLQDPIRITKRIRYSKWNPSILSISKNLSNRASNRSTLSNNEMLRYVATDDCSNIPSIENNLEYSKNAISSVNYPKLFDNVIQQQGHNNDTDMQVRRSVFLKPGKCWARSLSILSNVKPGSDLDKLCAGKGKKWRDSVKDIFDMQKQGLGTSITSSLGDNRYKTANHDRFSNRISIRVVLNNNVNTTLKDIKYDVKNASFLEACGTTVENLLSKSKTLHEDKFISNAEYDGKDQNSVSHSATAKDIVLQRCSQKHYLSFSDCFPDWYLEHCRKIGEGVYGEVFLYEYEGEKSVVKIIPIEGKELVNGEPQKKFNEILPEIVIAEELDNLRLHSTCRTNAFVEVRSIRCIIGRYPEKLVKLWNIYNDDKGSDNDCPSMFGKHQLYIVLELCHGGEDLEAFVFQTAEEAYASFLQTAVALAVAEKAFEFEHRDLHWGNVLISRTKESYVYYNLDGKEMQFPSNNVKVSIIDYTLSRMLYQGCCIYNDLALDPALFTAHGEYQFDIYRLMRNKIQNNWQKFEPYTNILWLHYILDKMITAVRYKRKNLKVHKQAINKLKELKDTILNYDSVYNFINDSNSIMQYMSI